MRSPTLAPASLTALTSFSTPPPTAWQDPLAVQPSHEPDGKALTHAPVGSILVTMPCSVATKFFLSPLVCCFRDLFNNNQRGRAWQIIRVPGVRAFRLRIADF